MKKNNLFRLRHFRLVLIGLLTLTVLLASLPPFVNAQEPQTPRPEELIRQAWENATASGRYNYSTQIAETRYPVPALTNSGRTPTENHMAMEGEVDLEAQKMNMVLWTDGSFDPATGIEIQVEGDQALARQGQSGEWEPINNVSSIFAPGGDPLAFLAGMKNVEVGETRDYNFLPHSSFLIPQYTQYTFDLNGPAIANYIRDQLERQLQQQGRLPIGMSLSTPEIYRQMNGRGELWLDSDGLPVRLSMDLSFPPSGQNGRIESTIISDLSNFDRERISQAELTIFDNSQLWLSQNAPTIQQSQQIAFNLTIILLVSALFVMCAVHWQSQKVYAAVALAVIFSMVIAPLMQGAQASAFFQEQFEAQTAHQTRTAEAEEHQAALDAYNSTDWNPTLAPAEQAETSLPEPKTSNSSKVTADDNDIDTDGDGLSDAAEAFYETCAGNGGSFCAGVADPTDTDADGLSDGLEVNSLGTLPTLPDSDRDGILDRDEISGFTDTNNVTWYLNPRDEDSNKDGLIDSIECPARNPILEDTYNANGVCQDTDSDGTPDVFDADNDDDGVPDGVDMSPFAAGSQTYDRTNPFNLEIDNVALDKPLYVEVQMRPTSTDHLTLYRHVLDWPTGDSSGPIQRQLETTWADTANINDRSTAANASNGDVRIIPMMEVIMPYTNGHYANLPLDDAAPEDRVLGQGVNTWLDAAQLDPFSIAINDVGDDGTLSAFVPLAPVTDENGSTHAFSARMYYRPEQGTDGRADWGAAHRYRLIWLVQMLNDECIDPTADPDTCARQDVSRTVHIYYDDWSLVGLNVSEELGLDAAILYEDPPQDTDLALDDQLTVTSLNLANTFLRGRDCDSYVNDTCSSDGNRDVTIANLAATVPTWFTSDNYTVVETFSYEHEAQLGLMASVEGTRILEDTFAAYAEQTIPTLMYAFEAENRNFNLNELASPTGSLTTVDLDPTAVLPILRTGLSWSPYQYVGGSWQQVEPTSYLELLEYRLSQQAYFQPTDESQDSIQEAAGKLVFAQLYFAAMFQGVGQNVAIDGESTWVPADGVPEVSYDPLIVAGVTEGLSTVIVFFANPITLRVMGAIGLATEYTSAAANAANETLVKLLGTVNPLTITIVAIAAVGLTLLAIGYFTNNETIFRIGEIIMAVATLIVLTIQIMVFIATMSVVISTTSGFGATLAAMWGASKGITASGLFGALAGVAIAWGFALYTILSEGQTGITLNSTLAIALALSLVAIVLYGISALGFGILGILLLLVDVIFLFLDKKGPTQYLVEWLASEFYDVNLLVTNMGSSNRLDIDLQELAFTNEELGFSVNGDVRFTIAVSNTMKYRKAFSFDQAKRRTAFTYALSRFPVDNHLVLERGSTSSQWDKLGNSSMLINDTVSLEVPIEDSDTGINRSLDLVLNESYLISYFGCWGKGETCNWTRIRNTNHLDLGGTVSLDMLPATVGEFAALTWNNNGTLAFPEQYDLDGDGLTGTDGTDPDDSQYDIDGDTLSDFYELANGLDPRNADTDGDGLLDHEELRYRTNPVLFDSDNDGLSDKIEIDGWLVSYQDGNTTKTFRVWSDPGTADEDDDKLGDLTEYTYAFHPYVSTDPSAIANVVQIDDLAVTETAVDPSPALKYQFEEEVGDTAFNDSVGDLVATCNAGAGACPVVGEAGRFGAGLTFDGVTDFVTSPIPFDPSTLETFTIAAWVKVDPSNSGYTGIIYQKSSGSVWLGLNGNFLFSDFNSRNFFDASRLQDGQWHHVAVMWNGQGADLYLDGVKETGRTDIVNGFKGAAGDVAFGAVDRPTGDQIWHLAGSMDEVVMYDRELSTAELSTLIDGFIERNDLIVQPGDELSYEGTITNTLVTQAVDGFLFAETEYLSPTVGTPAVYFPFEQEDYVTTVVDTISGGGYGASCIEDGSCPNLNGGGRIGSGVQFNSNADYLTIPNISQGIVFDPGFPFSSDEQQTIAFWVRPNARPAAGKLATILDTDTNAEGVPTNGAVSIHMDDAGHLLVDFGAPYGEPCCGAGASDPAVLRSEDPLALNSWQHIVISYLRLDFGEPRTSIFIDQVSSGDRPLELTAPKSLTIGPGRLGNNMDGTAPFRGQIDELVFYNDDTFSPSETNINRLDEIEGGNYYPGLNRSGISTSYPSFLLRFNENNTNRPRGVINSMSGGEFGFCSGNQCPGTTAAGQFGEALNFDGTNDRLTTDYVLDPAPQTFTAMAWIKADTANGIIIEQADGTGTGRTWLGLQGSNNLFANIGGTTVQSSASLSTGQWYHAAVTYDGSTTRLYLDGQLVGEAAATAEASDGGLFIGSSQTPNNFFDGVIDDLFIMPAVTDQAGIQSIMNHSYPAIIIDDPFVDFEIDPNAAVGSGDVPTALAYQDLAFLATRQLFRVPDDLCTGGNCPAILTDSGMGESLQFDGVNDWLSLGDGDFGNTWFVSFWMKRDGAPNSNETIFSATNDESPYQRSVAVEVTSAGVLNFTYKRFTDAGNINDILGSMNVTDGEWHHIVLGRELNTGDDYLVLYVDGVLEERQISAQVSADGGTVAIGRLNQTTPRYFEGEIDEFIYSRENTNDTLSDAVVAVLYDRPAAEEFATYATTVTSSATVRDIAGSGLHSFEETVEAAIQLQQAIPFPVVDDRSSDLRVFSSFEEVPNVDFFENLIVSEEDFTCEERNCPTSGLRGMIDRALLFDGFDDYLAGPTLNLFSGTTVAAWVKADRGTIADIDGEIILSFDSLQIVEDDGGFTNLTMNVPENEWAHVVATYNRGTGATAVYVNGVLADSDTADTGKDGRDLIVGSSRFFNNVLNGYLDDLRIYNGVLTAGEVQTLYEASAPVLRFEFDEDSTATAFADSSPNGFIGVPAKSSSFDSTLGETVITYNPVPGTDGQIGNTGLFQPGVGLSVSPVDDSLLDLDEMTIMMWVRPDGTRTGFQNLVSKHAGGSNRNYQINFFPETLEIVFSIQPDICSGFNTLRVDAEDALDPNIWTHVAATFDGTTMKIFLNGNFVKSRGVTSATLCKNDEPVRIGGNYEGEIDEFAMYGRALTDAELLSIYLRELRWYRARATQIVTIDNETPSIELLSDESYRQDGYIQLAVSTPDKHSYVDVFEIGIKGPSDAEFAWGGAVPCADTAQAEVWCPVFDTTELESEGVYEVQFRAIDAAGNETTSTVYTINVDGQAPTLSASGLNGGWANLTKDPQEKLKWTLPLDVTVTDPILPGGTAGSGVDANSVIVALYDAANGELLGNGGWQQMSAAGGNSYTVDYIIFGDRPNSLYNVVVSAQDEVGNHVSETVVGTVRLDGRQSQAETYGSQLPDESLNQSLVISGTVSDLASFGGELGIYRFEQDAGATIFYDGGINHADGNCANATCPTITAGLYGNGLTFDGAQNRVTIPNLFNPISDTFSISLWFNPSSAGSGMRVLALQDNGSTGSGPLLLWLNGSNQLVSSLGGSTPNGSVSAAADSWHHAVLTFDGQTLNIYLNGQLDSETVRPAPENSDGNLLLGSGKTAGNISFTGQMDEVTVYDGVLSEEAVYALYQGAGRGVSTVEVGFELVDFATISDTVEVTADFWLPATVDGSGDVSTWSFAENTPNREDFYNIHLRSTDVAGNVSSVSTVWRGLIDRVAPQVVASGQLIGGSNAPQTEYTFTFTDLLLDAEGLTQPCGVGELVSLTYNDSDLPYDGQPYEISATCRVDGHEAGRDITACDVAGNCSTERVTPTAAIIGNITIEAPADNSSAIVGNEVTLSGGAYDPTSISSIVLYANDVEIASASYSGNDTTWTAAWTPAIVDSYLIEAVMVGASGTYTDSITLDVVTDPYTDLIVEVDGTGSGLVTSDPTGIACGVDCDERYLLGTVVTLTTSANTGSVFTGWSGDCTGTADCVVTLNSATAVTATFTLEQYDLTVNKNGGGDGTITSIPLGLIDCGSDCSETLDYGTVVTLTATAASESQFVGWSGACAGIGDCVVTMTDAQTIAANFVLNKYLLTTGIVGDGDGTITSDPVGINCQTDCDGLFDFGEMVTLTAVPDGSSVFTGWEGDCSGQNCALTIDSNKVVTATFAQDSYDLTVTLLGDGTGTITSNIPGISCAGDCTESYDYGTVVTLTAAYDRNAMSLTWSGACSAASGDSCTVTMDQVQNVVATFTLGEFSLGAIIAGGGNGSVTSTPAGIDCDQDGGVCNTSLTANSVVTLTASAGLASYFDGWQGAGCSGTGDCVVTLDESKEVIAIFILNSYTLTVNKTGTGSGTINDTSGRLLIDCGTVCETSLVYGTVLTLTATADVESNFVGWGGSCTGAGDCVVTIDGDEEVTAGFDLNEYELSISTTGNGFGLIVSDPLGISCGTDCAEDYAFGTTVTLTAVANSGSLFAGWSGACTGNGSCMVTMDQAQHVTATFELAATVFNTLSVSLTGEGTGTVSSDPSGIDCNSSCAAEFAADTAVMLTATPAAGSLFDGWGGACAAESSAVCSVVMSEAQSVTASFRPEEPTDFVIYLPAIMR